MNILDLEKFEDTFGPKNRRKKAKLSGSTLEELVDKINETEPDYNH